MASSKKIKLTRIPRKIFESTFDPVEKMIADVYSTTIPSRTVEGLFGAFEKNGWERDGIFYQKIRAIENALRDVPKTEGQEATLCFDAVVKVSSFDRGEQ